MRQSALLPIDVRARQQRGIWLTRNIELLNIRAVTIRYNTLGGMASNNVRRVIQCIVVQLLEVKLICTCSVVNFNVSRKVCRINFTSATPPQKLVRLLTNESMHCMTI